MDTEPGVMADEDFDLDLTFLQNGPVIAELANATSDNCGSTTQSACITCMIGS